MEIEATAALGLLDQRHNGQFQSIKGDDYIYTGGEINGHNVVVATLPAGEMYGIASVSSLANHIKWRFRNLWFALLVGVAAGLPNHTSEDSSRRRDIRLGDVLVALPHETRTGIVQYDLGRDTGTGFIPNNRQTEPPSIVRAAIRDIRLNLGKNYAHGSPFWQNLTNLQSEDQTNKFTRPDQETDRLYARDGTTIVPRKARHESEQTIVWYGEIGSGNALMRNSNRGHQLRDQYNLIGLEMEAAGVVNVLPTGVIRGVCDYGDEHKSKEWQGYASATAGVYAKCMLQRIKPESANPSQQKLLPKARSSTINAMDAGMPITELRSREYQIRRQAGSPQSVDWIWSSTFADWLKGPDSFYWITGLPGSGKSCLMSHIASSGKTKELLRNDGREWNVVEFFFDFRAGDHIPNRLDGMLRALIHQMTERLRKAAEQVDTTILGSGQDLPVHVLVDIAAEIIASSESNVCMFIDGLDEYKGSGIELLETIDGFVDQVQPKLKVCLASRPEPIFLQRLEQYSHLAVQDFNNQGIDFYINSVWRDQQLDTQSETIKELGDMIRQRAKGNFLWVRLAMDETLQGLLARKSVGELRQGLKEMPEEIGKMYENMLSRLSKIVFEEATILLRLIADAGGSIDVEKLYVGLAAVLQNAGLHDRVLDFDASADNKERLLSLLGNFIDLEDEEDARWSRRRSLGIRLVSSKLVQNQGDSARVKFSHETLQSFCLKSKWFQEQLPHEFVQLYPDYSWLRLFAGEIVNCHVSDEHLVSSISKDLHELISHLRRENSFGRMLQHTMRRRKHEKSGPDAFELLMSLLQRWPKWTLFLPYALDEFGDEARSIFKKTFEVHSSYKAAVDSSAFMLHCGICAVLDNIGHSVSHKAYDFWRPNFSDFPPSQLWPPYAALCHRNLPAIQWHVYHDAEHLSAHNPQAILDATLFDSNWSYDQDNIHVWFEIFKTLANQGATFDTRHVCSLIDYLSDTSQSRYFDMMYDLMSDFQAEVFNRGHQICSARDTMFPEPISQARWVIAHWSWTHHGGSKWMDGMNPRPLLDKSLISIEQTTEQYAEILSLALDCCLEDISDTHPMFPYNVLQHRMSKVIEVLRRAAEHQATLEYESAVDKAKLLHQSLDAMEVKVEKSGTVKQHQQAELNGIIDLLEYVKAHRNQLPANLGPYEDLNCWYEIKLTEEKTLDGHFLILGPLGSDRRLGPYRRPDDPRPRKKSQHGSGRFGVLWETTRRFKGLFVRKSEK